MTPTIAEVDTLLRTTFAASDSARICDLIGEMLARLDPDTQVIVTRAKWDALLDVAEAARVVAFVYVEPVMDEDLYALRAALARLGEVTR